MAKKVQAVDILPTPSSSDDEIEDQDGSSRGTDDEQQPPLYQKPQTDDDEPVSKPEPVSKNPSLQQPQESEESDDDSDETQNSPSACAFTVKPIVSKPVSKSPEPKTRTSMPAQGKSTKAKSPADSEEATKAVSKNQDPGKVKGGTRKRHAEVEKVEMSKKSKVSNGEGQSVGKVEKGSKSKKGTSADDESGKKSKVSNGEGQSVGKVEKGSKSKKGTSVDDESGQVEEKKSLVKWSEEDEAALLNGIIDYKAETGEDVNSNVGTFYEYVKDSFSVNLTEIQLYEKIKRLKKKFETNADKWKNGEEPVFSRPHDSELFELSKKIWGSEGTVTDGNDSKVESSKNKDKKDGNVVGNTGTLVEPVTSREHFVQEEIRDTIMEDEEEVTQDFCSLYPQLCASLSSQVAGYLSLRVEDLKEYVKGIISGMGEEKARELEDGWKAVHVMDHQLYARRAHLISEQSQAVSDLFNQS